MCHLRFDDTNPEKEDQEYVDSIKDAVQWLGFDWQGANGDSHLYYASNYFDFMYRAAVYLIEQGLAYVDEQSAEDMKANRGDFTRPGANSPFRDRSVAENLQRFADMKDGKLADGAAVLRAKIDMSRAQHQPARPGHLPRAPCRAPQHRQPVVHLPDVHLRPPHRGRAGAHHPLASARWNLKTSARSTTGCWTTCAKAA